MKRENRFIGGGGIFIFLIPLILISLNPMLLTAQQHGDLVRIQGEEKIYLIQNGQRRNIVNEEVFKQMGFKMEDVKELDAQSVMSIPEGPPLLSKEPISPYPEGALIRLKGKAQPYVIRGGRKCFIPDNETFQAYGFQWDQVIEVDQTTFNKIPTGIPLASIKPRFQYGAPGIPPPGTTPLPPGSYPPGTYPPATTPYPQPSPSPSPPGQQPTYPPPTGPPPQPSHPPSSPPPSKSPSSFLIPPEQLLNSLRLFFVNHIYHEFKA